MLLLGGVVVGCEAWDIDEMDALGVVVEEGDILV